MKTLFADIETYSDVDLSVSGTDRYVEGEDFNILLFAYSEDGGPVQIIDLASGERIPNYIIEALADDSVTKWAHNARFERICLSRYLDKDLDPESWRCSMVACAYLGLPFSLDAAAQVVGAEVQKMSEGKALIRYFSRPPRHYPHDDPERWALFKEYCKRDVETEIAILDKIKKHPVPDSEWENYVLDQRINDRGIRIDEQLVAQALIADEQSHHILNEELKRLTGLANPNSPAQIKEWLAQHGVQTESIDKRFVKEILPYADDEVKRVLELRQELAKASVRKYDAMQNVVCSDGRARGLFQFYGAAKTGRFSGRLIMLHNLPQNHMPNLDDLRAMLKDGDVNALAIHSKSIPTALSELIRTAFIPAPDRKFIAVDFSSIERVVLAWLAGEEWVLQAYDAKRDLYAATASQMFNVPIESVTKGSELRQRGKVGDLACIAKGEFVLTNTGPIPIEEVTPEHTLWDGESWVTHEGVVFMGYKEVIEYDELCATTDHLVWIEGKPEPVQFGLAAACGARLIQTGDGGNPIRLGRSHQPGKTMECYMEPLFSSDTMHTMRQYPVDESEQPPAGAFPRMPALLPTKADSQMAGQTADCCQTALCESARPTIPQLRGTRYRMAVCVRNSSRLMGFGELSEFIEESGDRSNRHQRTLRAWQYPVCNAERESEQPSRNCDYKMGSEVLAICVQRRNEETIKRYDTRRYNKGCGNSSIRETEKLARHLGKAPVYDIRNAGRHHRFTVSGKLVHNCGYGGGTNALIKMGALDMGLKPDELQGIVDKWRAANPHIVRLWKDVDKAAKHTIRTKSFYDLGLLNFDYRGGMLTIRLPSGRRLFFIRPRVEKNNYGYEQITYDGEGPQHKWCRLETYGARLVENCIQGIARDVLCDAMQRLERTGLSIVLHCHDEVVVEASPKVSVDAVSKLMTRSPDWAKDLKLRAEGFESLWYKKG
ncbi:hypothetical protein FACS18948_6830 [Clostridia bacterium]|nr:hypothetical protein FACS18948_6830 [Clostridia bacterium]